MKRNIVIRFEPDNMLETKEYQVYASNEKESELLHQSATDTEITSENTEQRDTSTSSARTSLQNDPWIYRIVVGALALTLLSSVGGAVYLQANGKQIPDILSNLGSVALGGLAGLLAPTPTRE